MGPGGPGLPGRPISPYSKKMFKTSVKEHTASLLFNENVFTLQDIIRSFDGNIFFLTSLGKREGDI